MVLSVGNERRGIDAATQLSDETVSGTREFREPQQSYSPILA
jgi:hypothetical protein